MREAGPADAPTSASGKRPGRPEVAVFQGSEGFHIRHIHLDVYRDCKDLEQSGV